MKLDTYVYVDGFNLYYGCLKGTAYKWLNLSKLCTMLLPECRVKRIRYFTALVTPTLNDPQKLQRQLTLIRALETIPNLTVHYGHFLTHSVRRPMVNPPKGSPTMVKVVDTKEKGSDVALATYLLIDGFKKDYQMAVVISDDSDLAEPIKLTIEQLGLPVGVLHPSSTHSTQLSQVAKFYRPIRERALKVSLFPPTFTDVNGTITKPATW